MAKRRTWQKEELLFCYYVAKYGFGGLEISRDELIFDIIGNTTIKSFDYQTANFRSLLGMEGGQLVNYSNRMRSIAIEYSVYSQFQLSNICRDQIRAIRTRNFCAQHNTLQEEEEATAALKSAPTNQLSINF